MEHQGTFDQLVRVIMNMEHMKLCLTIVLNGGGGGVVGYINYVKARCIWYTVICILNAVKLYGAGTSKDKATIRTQNSFRNVCIKYIRSNGHTRTDQCGRCTASCIFRGGILGSWMNCIEWIIEGCFRLKIKWKMPYVFLTREPSLVVTIW